MDDYIDNNVDWALGVNDNDNDFVRRECNDEEEQWRMDKEGQWRMTLTVPGMYINADPLAGT
jgi:hypothetical protein